MSPTGSAGFLRGLGLIPFGIVLELASVALGVIQPAMGTTQLGPPFAALAQSMMALGVVVALPGAVLLWSRAG